VALAVAAVALLHVGWIIYEFSVDTAALPPGTGIRPMGPYLSLFLASAYSFLGGGCCSLVGVFVGLKQRRALLVVAALLTLGLSSAPWFVGGRALNQIVEARKLVIEP
jgi:hypothetical protein